MRVINLKAANWRPYAVYSKKYEDGELNRWIFSASNDTKDPYWVIVFSRGLNTQYAGAGTLLYNGQIRDLISSWENVDRVDHIDEHWEMIRNVGETMVANVAGVS